LRSVPLALWLSEWARRRPARSPQSRRRLQSAPARSTSRTGTTAMTGTTAATGRVVETGGLGMAITGFTIVGMASVGTVAGTSGLRTAMTGTTVATGTVVGTGGLGMATVGTTTVGMAASGAAGEHLRHERWIIRRLRAWPADRAGSAGQGRPTVAAVTVQRSRTGVVKEAAMRCRGRCFFAGQQL
jgi:hypothetical protein